MTLRESSPIVEYPAQRGPYSGEGKRRTYLAEVRLERGLTQYELADKVDVAQTSVHWWESGVNFLTYERCEALSKHLKVKPEILFARHNLDTVQMFTDRIADGAHLNHRVAVMMLDKLRRVLAYRWKLPDDLAADLNQTYRWLLQEAFARHG